MKKDVEKKGWKKEVEKKVKKKEVEKELEKKRFKKKGWKKSFKDKVGKWIWEQIERKKDICSCWAANWLLVSKSFAEENEAQTMKIKWKNEWTKVFQLTFCPNLFHHEVSTGFNHHEANLECKSHIIWSFDRMMITKWTENLSLLLCNAWFNSEEHSG